MRKVVIDLISTLNAMHEDYHFSDAGADRFVKHSTFNAIIPAINKNLAEVVELRNEGFLNTLWLKDKAINVRHAMFFRTCLPMVILSLVEVYSPLQLFLLQLDLHRSLLHPYCNIKVELARSRHRTPRKS